jgi:HK97 gp10 family phage protein
LTIIGLQRLEQKLKRTIPDAVIKRVREAMAQSADQAVAAMKRLAPVETGDLQMSISWTWGDAPKGAIAIASKASKASGLRITIYAGGRDAYYARFIEFGTSPHINKGKFAGSKNPGTTAQPFFYPGWRLVRKSAKSRVTRGIKQALKEGSN